MPVQKNNRTRNPGPQNTKISLNIACNCLNWTTSDNNSTVIEVSRFRSTSYSFRLEKGQHESEKNWNGCDFSEILNGLIIHGRLNLWYDQNPDPVKIDIFWMKIDLTKLFWNIFFWEMLLCSGFTQDIALWWDPTTRPFPMDDVTFWDEALLISRRLK
jgi:hypothetical protein